jgi:cytochrome P450
METKTGPIPLGPEKDYHTNDDLLDWMRSQFLRFGDIYKGSVYGINIYAIRDPDFAHHVLVENWQNYVKGQFIKRVAFLLGNGLMVSEGDHWAGQRRTIQPTFDRKSIRDLTQMIASVNSRLLKKWQRAAELHQGVNVTRDVSAMALEVVLRFILGEDYDQIGPHFDILTQESGRDLAFAQSFRCLGKFVLAVIDRRRKAGTQAVDALGALMQARDPHTGQSMHDRQLINEILTLIVAGHETTASTLNWTWYLLSQNPKAELRLSDELKDLTNLPDYDDLAKYPYTRQVIEESMRLYPAGWLMTRKALRDDQLGAYFVPAGTEIFVSPYFIQRNPALWENPDFFDPDRFDTDNLKNRHRLAMIPFSAGPRNCIGSFFARFEMQIHLLTVASHLRLEYVQSKPIKLEAGVNLRSRHDFIMYPEAIARF